jgi:hypothetical protein
MCHPSPPGFSWQIDFKEEVKQEKEEVGVGQVEWCVRFSQIQLHLRCFIPNLFFMLKKMTTLCFGMGPKLLKRFYSCTIECLLTGCITDWYGNCLASDRKPLQRVVRTPQYITGVKLPAIQDLYTRRCQRKTPKKCQRLQSAES